MRKAGRNIFILWGLLLALPFSMLGQERTLTGNVSDESGPLPGVSVVVVGTQVGTETDFEGNFEVNATVGDVLRFSYVGMKTVDKKILYDTSQVNVTLQENSEALDEVVVTALGITRDKKSLGYATQEVSGDDVSQIKQDNFVNSLSGKVSGVQIKSNNNIGGSTNVLIRGVTSLTGNNQALFVVDGVPMDNSNTNNITANSSQDRGGAGYDYGNAASDINPENIESVNVLKGAAATALYGSRAANGAIIITTKKGHETKGIGVTINSSITTGSIDKSTFVDYQKIYGAGDGGNVWGELDLGNGLGLQRAVNFAADASYGPIFNPGLLVYQWNALDIASPYYQKLTPWTYPEHDASYFFKDPLILSNSIAFNGANEYGNFRLGYTKFDQEGIMPNSFINRDDAFISGSYNLSDKFIVSGTANYIKTDGKGRNETGYSENLVTNFRQWWQTSVDMREQKDMYFRTKRNVTWNYGTDKEGKLQLKPIFWDNPYWQRYENYQDDQRNRFFGNMTLNYQVTDWLEVMARAAVDTYSELREERTAIGSVNLSEYVRFNNSFTEENYDLMLNFDVDIQENLHLKAILGGNSRSTYSSSIRAATNGGLLIPDIYSLSNSIFDILDPIERESKVKINGIYASASLGFEDTFFLDLTGRRDQSSTISYKNGIYYYPSAALSVVFSNYIESNLISFGKVRFNYAEVGSDAPFAKLQDTYVKSSRFDGLPLYTVGSVKYNPDLKPERTSSWETGLNMDFIGKRVGFDVSAYKTNSVDQIAEVALSPTTGYISEYLNAGEIENKGIEVQLYGQPLSNEKVQWNISINWSTNNNKVISLPDGLENFELGSFQGGITVNAKVGKPYGSIQGTDYQYIDGQRVVDEGTGLYLKTKETDIVIGNINPQYNAGITNSFRYGDWGLSFLIDIQKGGDVFSLDQYYGQGSGLYKSTTFLNDLGYPVRNPIDQGGGFVNKGVNPDGTPNITRVDAFSQIGSFGFAADLPSSEFIYDASYVKLRELSLTYRLPGNIIEKTFLTDVAFTLTGSNLWIISKNLPDADPEAGISSGNLQGWQSGVLPTTRNYSFNVKITF